MTTADSRTLYKRFTFSCATQLTSDFDRVDRQTRCRSWKVVRTFMPNEFRPFWWMMNTITSRINSPHLQFCDYNRFFLNFHRTLSKHSHARHVTSRPFEFRFIAIAAAINLNRWRNDVCRVTIHSRGIAQNVYKGLIRQVSSYEDSVQCQDPVRFFSESLTFLPCPCTWKGSSPFLSSHRRSKIQEVWHQHYAKAQVCPGRIIFSRCMILECEIFSSSIKKRITCH